MWGVSKLHVSLGISSHHRRTTIASLSWLLLLIPASHSCIPCRVLVHFSGFLGRKGNYRNSFERHSSPPFIFIYFSRTNTLFTLLHIIFFFSSIDGWRTCLWAWRLWKNEDVHGFSKAVGRLALYSAQTISDTTHSVFDYLWVFGIQMRHWADCIYGVDGL